MYKQIAEQARSAISELLEESRPQRGEIVVVGCSSSEIKGERIGKGSAPEIGRVVIDSVLPVLRESGIYLAAQCCEHLNRALVLERAAAESLGYETVNAVPQPNAGGSFAAAAFAAFSEPVLVEHIKAAAGLDIGCTLIGMHLRDVAVALRIKNNRIGEAFVLAAKTRPKYTGGSRTQYSEHENTEGKTDA